ncbi:hypothetical protein [Polluticoccus soli]|uniref:hypothetical protein n=1 Tax=Polluticoccus soli TaxID=3034150 RepID=UPI0023E265B3|nr:hypothetical protein [Flavipsychrobacter sp. JY13-12]
MKFYLPVLTLALTSLMACKKVEVPQGKEEMVRGKWKLELDNDKGILKEYTFYPTWDTSKKPIDTLYTSNSSSETIQDTIRRVNGFPECKLDDFLEFGEGIDGVLNTGEKKCPSGETSEVPIKWGFKDNYTRMYIYEAGEMFLGNDDLVGDVVELSESRIKLRYQVIRPVFFNGVYMQDTAFYTIALKR